MRMAVKRREYQDGAGQQHYKRQYNADGANETSGRHAQCSSMSENPLDTPQLIYLHRAYGKSASLSSTRCLISGTLMPLCGTRVWLPISSLAAVYVAYVPVTMLQSVLPGIEQATEKVPGGKVAPLTLSVNSLAGKVLARSALL